MPGVRIRHRTARSTIVLVPIMSKPLNVTAEDVCPGCFQGRGVKTVHPVKTVHLWVDDSGACIVSTGVLDALKSEGMPDLDIVEEVKNPPPLTLGPDGPSREQQDYDARRINVRR
jgi:hypothetical protein